MKKTKLTVKFTTQFRKDYKLAMKRGLRIALLEEVVERLAMGEPLPEKNRDHALTGDWVGHRECHIQPDWLLIYRIEDDVLVRLIAMPNVIVTSHQAVLTREALNNIAAATVENLLKFKRGEAAPDPEVCYRCAQ